MDNTPHHHEDTMTTTALIPIERMNHCEVCEGLDGYRSIIIPATLDGTHPITVCLDCLLGGVEAGVKVVPA